MRWFFSPQLPGQVETEVTQRDQFSNDEVELSETIIREAIQNSLDAAADDPPKVHVSIRMQTTKDGLDKSFLAGILDEQLVHARAADLDLSEVPFDSPSALLIEDFGTKGLTGCVSSKDNDNFSDFWRRHGKSHKTGKSRGRWGLGKLVYSATSQVGVFFGLTLRDGDSMPHLMGQTVLKLRQVDSYEYPPHAFFAHVENEGDRLKEFPVPGKDQDEVDTFIQQFGVQRSPGQNGLSIIIPFPNPNFHIGAMIGTAIANYFYPIITKQLTLRFDHLEVNSSNVRELAYEHAKDKFADIDALFDFIEEAYKLEDKEIQEMRPSWLDDGRLDEEDFEPEVLDSIRTRYVEGQLVSLRLPITLKQKNGNQVSTYFSIFLKKPTALNKGIDLYVRGGLTLPGEEKFRDRKALGAMIADDDEICSFLGYAENAAHTKWVGSAEKLKQRYKSPNKPIQAIKQSLVQLYDLLSEEIEEVDEQALRNFFWVDEPEADGPSQKKPKKTPIPIPPEHKPRPRHFSISKIEGGFSVVTPKDANTENYPQTVKIEVAYDVGAGNPFKKYSPHDFKLGQGGNLKIALTKGTGKIVSRAENTMLVEVESPPFGLHVTGFDDNRDVKIKLTKEG
ncbi:hypothetical protein [Marinobacterium stanieri]|uniref:Uncharacterized protein n=1 Tax=Marinobacterium stanieri TaxID=49186 RepID=A0A1N6T7L3_9GAMM|nr:hypothetical protein [Marinobacterium stanieri]SIQ49303.1 hypothetical protein SAMN05421647_105168 [Marinobacterium stanieri]